MTRRVQQRQTPAAPFHMGLGGEDRNAALPLQRVKIQSRVSVIHPARPSQQSAAIENGLRQRRLPRVHMGQKAHADVMMFAH